MLVCPKCGREINGLEWYKYATVESYIYIDKDGEVMWDDEEVLDVLDESFFCPVCGEKLFENFRDAVTFLTGEHTAPKH